MKAIEKNLYQRGNSFYYRSVIPSHLSPLLSYREIVFSLGVREFGEARIKCAQIQNDETKYIKEFEHVFLSLSSPEDKGKAIDAFSNQLLGLKMQYRLSKVDTYISPKEKTKGNLLFSVAAKEYMQDCISDALSTRMLKEKSFELFVELMGDKPFHKVTKEDVRQFKILLLKIPANARKIYKVENLKELDVSILPDAKRQDIKTINNKLMCLNALYNWAFRMDKFEGRNPFSHMLIKNTKGQLKRRKPFTSEELQVLFMSPVYTGCKGKLPKERLKAGNLILKNSLFWIPLIGLHSGMRLNEICQLYVSDIRYEQDILIFDINDGSDDDLAP